MEDEDDISPSEIDWSYTELDKNNLDEEWVRQPRIMGEHVRKAAFAKKRTADAKAELKVVTAELSLAVRNSPEKYGLKRATDAAVEAVVLTLKKHKRAVRRLHRAQLVEDLLTGMVKTLDHRKAALENEVVLHGQGYFARPRLKKGVSESLREEVDARRKKRLRRGD